MEGGINMIDAEEYIALVFCFPSSCLFYTSKQLTDVEISYLGLMAMVYG